MMLRCSTLVVASALVVLAGVPGLAYLGPRPPLDELIADAEAVFFGQVVDVRPAWETHANGRSIVSRITFHVIHTFKGRHATYAELEFLGGTIGDVTLSVADMPEFGRGDRDILFVNTANRPISPVVGLAHGRFRVVTDPASGVEVVRTHAAQPIRGIAALSLFSPPALAGPELTLRQFADELTRRIAGARGRQ